jgi:hypothetical protein
MGAKRTKVKLGVVADGIEVGGKWFHNGQELTVTERKATQLLKTGAVEKV